MYFDPDDVRIVPIEDVLCLPSVDSDPTSALRHTVWGQYADLVASTWNYNAKGRDMMMQVLAAKRHNPEYEVLMDSIAQFGVTSPIAIENGWVTNGHHRLLAMMDLGYTMVPVIEGRHAYDSSEEWLWDDAILPPPGVDPELH